MVIKFAVFEYTGRAWIVRETAKTYNMAVKLACAYDLYHDCWRMLRNNHRPRQPELFAMQGAYAAIAPDKGYKKGEIVTFQDGYFMQYRRPHSYQWQLL